MSRPTYMEIDLAALKFNLQRVHELAPHAYVIAMVKANAYGHGIVRVANALTEANAFGVASLEEGMMLREAGITQPIVLIEGLFNPDELLEAERQHFTLVVHHKEHVEMLEQSSVKNPFTVWLKINTGMHRLGVEPSEVASLYERLSNLASVKKPIGFMTHFAEADKPDCDVTQKQIDIFNTLRKHHSGPASLANSAAIIAWNESHQDWVRPGLILYGASPFAGKNGIDHGLQPVMTLSSRIIAITRVKKNCKVGYGGVWTAPEDMQIGVVGVGYGDGYPQFARNGTPVLVNGVECKLAGQVSMDMLTVDIRNYPQAKIGDPVVLWGKGLPVETVANYSNTTPYEILTRMTPRPKIQVIS